MSWQHIVDDFSDIAARLKALEQEKHPVIKVTFQPDGPESGWLPIGNPVTMSFKIDGRKLAEACIATLQGV